MATRKNIGPGPATTLEKKLPTRKSIAGPTLLAHLAATGTIRKNLPSEDSSEGRSSYAATSTPAQKDFNAIEGRIKVKNIIDVEKELLCCKYSEEFDLLAAGASDSTITLYKSDTGQYALTLADSELEGSNAPVTAIKHRPIAKNYPISNCFTCTYANGYVKCWNYNFVQCIYTIKENRETFGLTYHPRYPKFVTYGDNLKIYLYDEETKTQERILTSSNNPKVHDGPTSRVFGACFNPRSNYELLTGGWDDVVHFWDLRQPHSVRHISGVHICGEGLDVNQKGTEVLTCAFQTDSAFQIWDYFTGKLIAKMDEEDESHLKLYAGKFATKDYAICGGTAPNDFRVIDLSNYMSVGGVLGLPSAIYGLDMGLPKKVKENLPSYRSDFSAIPPVAFTSGRKLYQIEFH